MKYSSKLSSLAVLATSILAFAVPAQAGGDHAGGHGSHTAEIGRPGDPAKVTRTIEVTMHDNYYEPERVTLKQGETVRFQVTNRGTLVHEFNIGTAAMHAAHQEEMMKMMQQGMLEPDRIDHEMMHHGDHGMKHDDPNSVLLEPGQSAEVVWEFRTDAALEFACNVPGHYESGMKGDIELKH